MSDPRRFDRFIPLFGNKDDKRVRLFLHELQHNANEIIAARVNKTYTANDLKFKDQMRDNMQVGNFRDRKLAGDMMDYEWMLFFIRFLTKNATKVLTYADNKDELDIVRSLSGVINLPSKNGSIDQLVAVLLQNMTTIEELTSAPAPAAAAAVAAPAPAAAGAAAGRAPAVLPGVGAAAAPVVGAPARVDLTNTGNWSTANQVTFKNTQQITNVIFNIGARFHSRRSMDSFGYEFNRIGANVDRWISVDKDVSTLPSTYVINNTGNNRITDFKNEVCGLLRALVSNHTTAKATAIETEYNSKINARTGTFEDVTITVAKQFINFMENALFFNEKIFNLDVNKLLRRELANRKAVQQAPVTPDPFFNTTTLVSSSGADYYQDAQQRLWRGTGPTDPNAKRVDFESDEFKDLKEDKKCMSTGVFKGDTTKCRDYLMDCLSGNDIGKCKDYFNDPNFANDAKWEVQKMNPELMYSTLNAFQFRFNTSTNKVENFDSWVSSLKDAAAPLNLSTADITAIGSNGQLKSYLNMIVNKVNDNPDILRSKRNILNKTSVQTPTKSPISFLTRRNVVPNAAAVLNAALPIPYPMAPVRGGLVFGHFGQLGGGVSSLRYLEERKDKAKRLASTYSNMFTDVVTRLSKLNKSLDQGTTKAFSEHIEKLDAYETKTLEALSIYEKYLELHEFYGQNDQTNSLDVATAQAFADKHESYFNKVAKKRYTIQNLIEALENAAQNVNQNAAQPAASKSGTLKALP